MQEIDEALEKIKLFADNAHGEQMRRYTPDRYIVHPVRVMEMCREYGASLPMLAAALLHDVLEDTPVTPNELSSFLYSVLNTEDAEVTLHLVEEMTDVYTWEKYPDWNRKTRKQKEIERIAETSPEAQTIKYADIIDNSREISIHDPGFAVRYLQECRNILKKIDKGNEHLRELALQTVNIALKSLKNPLL